MEPERRDSTYTHIERDRRGSGMSFIIGGLVVAVAVIALVIWGGDWIGGGDGELSTQGEAIVVTDTPETPADVDVEVESQTITPTAPAENATPSNEAAPAEPVAPAQQ